MIAKCWIFTKHEHELFSLYFLLLSLHSSIFLFEKCPLQFTNKLWTMMIWRLTGYIFFRSENFDECWKILENLDIDDTAMTPTFIHILHHKSCKIMNSHRKIFPCTHWVILYCVEVKLKCWGISILWDEKMFNLNVFRFYAHI